MRKILDRERARADRTGAPLSVIAFAVRGEAVEHVAVAWLAKILASRLRATDVAGWLGDGRVCAVLPATLPAGAARVVKDVRLNFPAHLPLPLCMVYSYPSDHPTLEEAAASAPVPAAERSAAALDALLLKPTPVWKRGLDVLGAAAGLVLLAPVFAGIALAVKLTSPGPVFFGQWRSARGGQPFRMYKFRTMVADAEAQKAQLQALNERDGPAFKMKNDPRVTPVGRFLRCTSMDELPQLWNVLRGDMSLVGPRPLPCAESDACAGWQRQRLDVTPGLTCIWQVHARGSVSFADWVRMDVRYIRSLSLWQDLKLLLLTLPAVVLRRGAH
jgi:lipopolysaccharide/colanic/teichoic acid biosynthesis glycosyltransferase